VPRPFPGLRDAIRGAMDHAANRFFARQGERRSDDPASARGAGAEISERKEHVVCHAGRDRGKEYDTLAAQFPVNFGIGWFIVPR
jgi:hypothetical protein